MSYTLNVDAGVTGLENLDRLQTTMNSSTRAAEMMDEKLRQITGTNALLTKSLEIQKETLGAVRSQLLLMAEGAERASGGVTRLSGSVRTLGDSSQHAVSQVQAVGGALRTLEGAMPIRAAERFLTLIPGIGTALQAAFPIFGAIAFAEVIGRMISGVVKLAESWNPVLQAQRESVQLLQQGSKEIEAQSQRLRGLQLNDIARNFGASARLQAEAGDIRATAKFSDAENIARLSAQVSALQKIANGQPVSNRDLDAARAAGLQTPWWTLMTFNDEGARVPLLSPKDTTGTATFGAALSGAADILLTPAMQRLKAARQGQQADIITARQLNEQAADEQNRLGAGDRKVNVERAAELKRAWEDIEKASKKAAENFDTIIGPLIGGQGRFVTTEHFMNEMGGGPRIRTTLDDLEERQREARRLLPELLPDQFLGRPDIEAPAGFVTVQQQLQQMRRQAARRLSLQGVQGRLSDNTLQGQQSNIEAQTAMQMAALDREAQVIQDRVLDATKREEALADIESRRYDVALQAEQKMLELAVKQKEQFEQTITGLYEAARQHRVGGFLRGKLDQALDQIIGQVAGVIFDKIKLPGRGPSGVSIPDVLGGALKTATDENTTATDDNTRALKDLTDLLRARAGGGGSIGGARGGGGGWSPSWNGASGPFVLNAFPGAGGGFPGVMMQGLPSSSAGGSNGGWIPGMGGGGGGGWGGGGGNSPWDPHTNGGVLSPGGLTSGGAAGIMSKVGIGAASIGAIAAGIHAGGAGGGLETAAGVVGLASLAFPALAPVAMALGVVSSLFSQSRQQRETQIGNQLSAAQFMSPVAINASMSSTGTFADFDRFGDIRSSNLSPFPQIQNGYFVAQRGPTAPGQQTWVPVPGRTLNQFGGPSGGGTMNVTINALDSKSIVDNHASIGDAVARSLLLGSSPHLSETLTARTP